MGLELIVGRDFSGCLLWGLRELEVICYEAKVEADVRHLKLVVIVLVVDALCRLRRVEVNHSVEIFHLVDLVATQGLLVKGFRVFFILLDRTLFLVLCFLLGLKELLWRAVQSVLLHLLNTVETREDLDLSYNHVASLAE